MNDGSAKPMAPNGAHRGRRAGGWHALLGLLLALTAWGLPHGAVQAMEARSAAELVAMVDALWRGDSSHARMTMTVRTRRYQRSMSLEAWSQGKDRSLIRILAPKKDSGISTLKVERNIWNFLPKINRVTKVPPSMMMGAWMGSHFTNDDLVRESSFEDDYESAITFSGARDGMEIYEVTSTPRPDAPVVWGKVVNIIAKKTLLPVKAVYFDEDGVVARTLTFDDVRRFGAREVPSRLVLVPTDKPEESTEIVYEALELNVPVPEGTFSLQALQSRR